jgi:hypothetical protein
MPDQIARLLGDVVSAQCYRVIDPDFSGIRICAMFSACRRMECLIATSALMEVLIILLSSADTAIDR